MTIKNILCKIGLHNKHLVYTTKEKRYLAKGHLFIIVTVKVNRCAWCDKEIRADVKE